MEDNGAVVKEHTGRNMKNVMYMKSQELCKEVNMNKAGTVVNIHVGEKKVGRGVVTFCKYKELDRH